MDFFKTAQDVLRVDDVVRLDVSDVERLRVQAELRDGRVVDVEGPDAIELVLLVRPSALEGRRLRWARGSWAVHNLLGHPLMQVLAWLGRPDLGVRLHDATIPRPSIVAVRPWMP